MKKVLVVGGGASGMMAAGTAAQKGHIVHLYEKNDKDIYYRKRTL